MKSFVQLITPLLIAAIVLGSCGVERRTYMPGYYISWNNKQPLTIKPPKAITENEPIILPAGNKDDQEEVAEVPNTDVIMYASADNSISLKSFTIPSKKLVHSYEKNSQDSCDIIVYKKGLQVPAKVLEIGEQEIKYKRCDYKNGPTITINKNEVVSIKYPNGAIEQITTVSKTGEGQIRNEDAFMGLIFGIAAAFVLITFPFAIYYSISALRQIRENPGKYTPESKTMAIAGLIIGCLFLVLIGWLIFLLFNINFQFGI